MTGVLPTSLQGCLPCNLYALCGEKGPLFCNYISVYNENLSFKGKINIIIMSPQILKEKGQSEVRTTRRRSGVKPGLESCGGEPGGLAEKFRNPESPGWGGRGGVQTGRERKASAPR